MPIRIVPDKNQKSTNTTRTTRRNSNRGNQGGNSNLANALVPVVMSLFAKRPKLAIGIIIAGVIIFLIAGKGCGEGAGMISDFGTGGKFDLQKYDATEVFEPLADNRKNPLPEQFSLLKYAPRRLNQGQQGSCVGWASSYAARTILHARMTGKNPNDVVFSPSFVYNQIALENCQGTYLTEAMKTLQEVGDLPFTQFAYDESSCRRTPDNSEKNAARPYKINGYNRLTVGGDKYKTDLLAIKQNIAQGAPVVIGMMVGGSFLQSMQGKKVWFPNESDYNMRNFGGHAMCVIGYDDYLEGGAFQIMNSWGPAWGENGVAWVKYSDFEYFNKEAYGLYPMGAADEKNSTRLDVKFGIVDNKSGKNIPFVKSKGILFKTASPVKKGTQFKIESTNSIPCYTYVFGQETDGSSYVLFPYTKKHSPYCGITGTRLFPKDHSLEADNIGSKDFMAVIVTKKPIDYVKLNESFSQASGSSYAEKIERVLKSDMIKDVNLSTSNTINISCNTKDKNALAVVLEIDKK